ncbi:MAG TPA: multicopper oxidase domain-containing protein [Sporichthya sp.]|nr:multicopper oxidase domain-containing protein [Sporichthya sp.]
MLPRPHRLVAAAVVGVLVLAGCNDGDDKAASASAPSQPAAAEGSAAPTSGGATRTYYLAADPVRWNYAPDGRNQITGEAFDEDAEVFVGTQEGRIGPSFDKCLYRAYGDDSFGTPLERPDAEAYLGNLGPTMHAEVGDTIRVVFRNNCGFPTSIHPHGVFYDKGSEGAGYSDGSTDSQHGDDAVDPGGTYTYTWQVPERAGPGPMDGSSAVWMYHSHHDEIGDVYAGLSGFLVVTAKGKAKPDGSPADIDHEVFSMFLVDDENSSPLLDANLRRSTGTPDVEDEDFIESNLKHAINGYLYGNGPIVKLRKGERVRWYLMAMGTEVDLHTPHWHGNTAVVNGMRTDVVNLLPASMLAADMTPDAVGTWLFHCHVADHIAAGMQTRYEVTDA